MEIRVGHSPDPDDAFMYWALTTEHVDRRGFSFEQVLADIQTLNQWARAGRLEVTAISLAAYPFVQEDYALLTHGASIGSGYGPIVVTRDQVDVDALKDREIVVPGALTTHFSPCVSCSASFATASSRSRSSPTRWPRAAPRRAS